MTGVVISFFTGLKLLSLLCILQSLTAQFPNIRTQPMFTPIQPVAIQNKINYESCATSINKVFEDPMWFEKNPHTNNIINTNCEALALSLENNLPPSTIQTYCNDLFLTTVECQRIIHPRPSELDKRKDMCISLARKAFLTIRAKMEVTKIC
jgi:hypothetical protein